MSIYVFFNNVSKRSEKNMMYYKAIEMIHMTTYEEKMYKIALEEMKKAS